MLYNYYLFWMSPIRILFKKSSIIVHIFFAATRNIRISDSRDTNKVNMQHKLFSIHSIKSIYISHIVQWCIEV